MQGFVLSTSFGISTLTDFRAFRVSPGASMVEYGYSRRGIGIISSIALKKRALSLYGMAPGLNLTIASWPIPPAENAAFRAIHQDCHMRCLGGGEWGVSINSAAQLDAIFARINEAEPLPPELIRNLKLASGFYPELEAAGGAGRPVVRGNDNLNFGLDQAIPSPELEGPEDADGNPLYPRAHAVAVPVRAVLTEAEKLARNAKAAEAAKNAANP